MTESHGDGKNAWSRALWYLYPLLNDVAKVDCFKCQTETLEGRARLGYLRLWR